MKRKLLFLLLSLSVSLLFAQYDGTLDNSFGTNGKVITDFQQHDYAYAIALQPDGKIILAGYSSLPMNPGHNYLFALSRYNTNGTLDNTFGIGGLDTFDFGFSTSYDETGWTMVLQADGKIIVAGNHFNSNNDFAVVRFNTDGSPDNTFGTGGKVMTDLGKQDGIFGVALQNDGKIVVCGFSGLVPLQNDFALARYNSDGTLDNTFGTNGKLTTDFGDREEAWSVKVLSDGKILVGGFTGSDFALARYNADGTLDNTFNGSGKVTTDFVGSDCGRALIVQDDGKYLLWGFNDSDYVYHIIGARYNTDGSLDNSFGSNGKVKSVCPGQLMLYTAATQADGKFVVGGEMLDDFFVARFLANGSIDNSFDTNGIATVDFLGWGDQGYALAIQSDNKILLGGNIHNGSNRDFALVRFNASLSNIDKTVKDGHFNIYPNPVKDILTIENTHSGKDIGFEIISHSGQVIYKEVFHTQTVISTRLFAPGLYIIKFDTGEVYDFKKIIVQ